MPLKFTWKSLSGVLAILAGAVSQATSALPPGSGSSWTNFALIFVGGLIVAVERAADAKDFATTAAAKVPGVGVGVDAHIPPVDHVAAAPLTYAVPAGQIATVTGPARVIAPTSTPPAA